MSNKCLRWGMCGLGRITNDFCSAMKTLPEGEHEVVAVASSSIERAKIFSEKFGVKSFYGAYEDLSKDQSVEIVYIGTNHISHYALCIMMLNAGKHVLCEKPMTMSLKHTKEILELAKKKLFVMEGFWTLTFPIYKQIRKELASGSLGDVKMVTVNMGVPLHEFVHWFKKESGGGMLLPTGVYPVMFSCMVFDEMPQKVIAEAFVNDEGVDEYGSIILRYSNNRIATLVYSGKACKLTASASIQGEKDSIEIPELFFCPSEVTLPSGHYVNEKPNGPVKYNNPSSGGLRYEADTVRQCILEDSTASPQDFLQGYMLNEPMLPPQYIYVYVRGFKLYYNAQEGDQYQGKTECPLVSHRLSEMIMTIIDKALNLIGVTYDL